MDTAKDVRLLGEEFPSVRSSVECAMQLVQETYAVEKDASMEKCLKIISQALQAAQTARCWVFDLHSTEPGLSPSSPWCGDLS